MDVVRILLNLAVAGAILLCTRLLCNKAGAGKQQKDAELLPNEQECSRVKNCLHRKKRKPRFLKKQDTSKKLCGFLTVLLVIVFVLMIVGLLNKPVWEANDDPAIALLLSRADTDYSPFQWRLLSIILHSLYLKLPGLNWWAVFSVVSIFVSVGITLYVFRRRFPGNGSFAVLFVLTLLSWFVALNRINFTRTAIMIAVAGCLLIADSVFVSKMTKRTWIQYFFGCLWFLMGASVRAVCAMFALMFLGVIGAVRFLSDSFTFKISWFKKHLRQGAMLLVAAALFFTASFLDEKMLTQEQSEFLEYNTLRATIQDFGSNYPTYQEAEETYQDLGIDENAWGLLFNWYTEDSDVFSTDTLEQIQELSKFTISLGLAKDAIRSTWFESVMAFVVVLLIFATRKSLWRQLLFTLGAAVFVSALLVIMGRFPGRIYASIIWAGVCALLFVASIDSDCAKQEKRGFFSIIGKKELCGFLRNPRVFTVILAVWCAVTVGFGVYDYTRNFDTEQMKSQEEILLQKREINDLIDADRDHIYIYDILNTPAGMDQLGFWEVYPATYCVNRFELGGWNARHPYFTNRMEGYGITNPTRALFERTDVYSTYTLRLHKHLQNYYDEKMTASVVRELNGCTFVQYAAFLDTSSMPKSETTSVSVEDFSVTFLDGYMLWAFLAQVNEADVLINGAERVFYCNVAIDGEEYTYRLYYEDGKLSAKFHSPVGDLSSAQISFQVFEQTANGQYVSYPTS